MNNFAASLMTILPELFLALAGMALLILGASQAAQSTRKCVMGWSVAAAFVIALLFLLGLDWERTLVFNDMFVMDRFAGVMKMILLVGLTASVLLSVRWLEQEQMVRFEYPLLLLFSGLGMMIMVSANDFLSAYMGLELQSLALYVLAAIRRDYSKAAEAGTKYFILGALSSGLLLFGVSLLYGFTGSTNFDVIAETLAANAQGEVVATGVIVGMVLVIVGIAFKLSAVPFHMWTPDVYEGAAMPVTALFAIVPKVAAAGLFIRILFGPFEPLMPEWQQVLLVLAVASMMIGSFAALAQRNIKRLMAYSSISHIGYAMIGLIAGSEQGVAAAITYFAIYMVMNIGAFGIILMMRREGRPVREIDEIAGLARYNPALGYMLAILMFSMGAIPPMAGFFSKMFVFQAAIAQEMYVLAVIGVLTSVVAVFYYLRIIKIAFFDEAGDRFDGDDSFVRRTIVALSLLFVIGFIFAPQGLVRLSEGAAAALF